MQWVDYFHSEIRIEEVPVRADIKTEIMKYQVIISTTYKRNAKQVNFNFHPYKICMNFWLMILRMLVKTSSLNCNVPYYCVHLVNVPLLRFVFGLMMVQ